MPKTIQVTVEQLIELTRTAIYYGQTTADDLAEDETRRWGADLNKCIADIAGEEVYFHIPIDEEGASDYWEMKIVKPYYIEAKNEQTRIDNH